MAGVLLEARSYRPFKSSEEYLYAMKEDLAEWLNALYPELDLNVDNFMDKLETGVVLCKHANNVRKQAQEYLARRQLRKTLSSAAMTQSIISRTAVPIVQMGDCVFRSGAKPGTFFARDNVSNFIDFARKGLEILECLLFETEDLIMRKNEKNVILCLLEVARRGAKYGMLAPILVQMEREIDRELAAERGETGDDSDEDDDSCMMPMGPIPQIVTNDLKSLDEMVRDLVEMCSCPTQFPMIRVSEGKYRIGDTKVLIFVRILRNHVMVRVGGGWDTLAHYLEKHDPCRCRNSHKAALSSKIVQKNPIPYELNNTFVYYERSPPRTRRSSASSSSSGQGGRDTRELLTASPLPSRNRSRSPTPRRDGGKSNLQPPKYVSTYNIDSPRNRSASPNPKAGRSARSRSPATPQRRPSHDLGVKSTRTRSRSPGASLSVQPRRSYDSPTAASRNRSRSPSARPVPTPGATKSKIEGLEFTNGCDSGSEVSDEGYRSLGVVTNETKSQGVADELVRQSTISDDSQMTDSPTSDRGSTLNDEEYHLNTYEDDKSTIKDGSLSGSCSELTDSRNTSREPSVDSNVRSSPDRSRRSSLMDDTNSSRRRSSMTRSRSASSGETSVTTPGPTRKYSGDKCGTWNGKAVGKRSSVNSDTFQRGGTGRGSLGASKTTYDPNTGRRIQKNVSPLLSDLLKVKDLKSDQLILQKMKELISQYSEILDPPKDDTTSIETDSSWMKNDERIARRKDSKYDASSKIPAPIYHKQPACEKQC